MNLSKVLAKGARVAFQVSGLPDPGEPTATFTVPFTLGDDGSITVGKVTKADEKAIAAMKVCPVSGEELGGEMGPPIKVTRGGQFHLPVLQELSEKGPGRPGQVLQRIGGSPR